MKDNQHPTVQRILEAAMDIFSEVGFNGARMDVIAKRAGVNKAMIYYHIGDKEVLYAEVLHNAIGHLADSISGRIEAASTPEEKLLAYIRGFAGAVEGNPRMGPILLREVASGGQNLPELVVKDFARLIAIVTSIIEEGKNKGAFVDVTPFILHMMVAGAIVLYKASGPIRAKKANIPDFIRMLDVNVSQRVVDEISNLLLQGIKKEPDYVLKKTTKRGAVR
ncbi:MAG: TetR/AcrR family transcriptional regulator [Syntrophales bacterium]